MYSSQHLTMFYCHFSACEGNALRTIMANCAICRTVVLKCFISNSRFSYLLTISLHFLRGTEYVSSLKTSTFPLFCCLPCFASRTNCFIHAASWATHMIATSRNNSHFVWTTAHIPYPTMMVEFGRLSLSSSVWHMSSVTLTLKPKPGPSVCLCSVSDRAIWTSEELQDAGTHSAQWKAE